MHLQKSIVFVALISTSTIVFASSIDSKNLQERSTDPKDESESKHSFEPTKTSKMVSRTVRLDPRHSPDLFPPSPPYNILPPFSPPPVYSPPTHW